MAMIDLRLFAGPEFMLRSTTKILLCNARARHRTIYDLSLPHITSQRRRAL
jgi:hypothetical protein